MHAFSHIDGVDVDEIIPLLDETSRPLAGGTDLLPLIKEGLAEPQRLVNLKRADELRYIRSDQAGLHIGALTTLDELAQHDLIKEQYTALAQAAQQAASPQLRNMATIGGNLLQQVRCWYYRGDFQCWLKGGEVCHAANGRNEYHAIMQQSPCVAVYPSDPPAALIALQASVLIKGPAGERTVAVADLLQPPTEDRHVMHTLGAHELIVEINVPQAAGRSVYLKAMDRAVWAYALASVAVAGRVEDGVARDVRIVLGGVANTPIRSHAAEAVVIDQPLSDDRAIEAGRAAIADAQPLEHNRYKLPLVRNLVAQALRDLYNS